MNISALRIALEWDGRSSLESREIDTLKSYAGFGGIPAVLFVDTEPAKWRQAGASEADLQLYPQIQELLQLLSRHFDEPTQKKVVDAIKHSTLSAFYTPPIVPETLFQVMQKLGISPRHMIEPSAGAGIFAQVALDEFTSIESISAVEKDILTGTVLKAIASKWRTPGIVHIDGFENVSFPNQAADLVVSNIPFGNFSVFDSNYADTYTSRIHNYFFTKGIDKVADGGLLAFITTDRFLNSPGNYEARARLFQHADLIALAVMPDNLMKATGNTEAPTHLLIVQRNLNKKSLSDTDNLLLRTTELTNEYGNYALNNYVVQHPDLIVGDEIKPGRNQYGKASQSVWQHGSIEAISAQLSSILIQGFTTRLDRDRFINIAFANTTQKKKVFTFLPVPEAQAATNSMQLGLFDTAPAAAVNRATAYLNEKKDTAVVAESARIVSTIRTSDKPGHDSIILLTARTTRGKQYVFRLHSNVAELQFPTTWKNANAITEDIQALSLKLKDFNHSYQYEGDLLMKDTFGLDLGGSKVYEKLLPFYRKGTLVICDGMVGSLGEPALDRSNAPFIPFGKPGSHLEFYKEYIGIRDAYLQFDQSIDTPVQKETLRFQVHNLYHTFAEVNGQLNHPDNRRRILNDAAFGNIILSSLERREQEKFVPSDILTASVNKKEEEFKTDDPSEALARSLNDFGYVNLSFITASTSLSEQAIITSLQTQIYLNPADGHWQTSDRYLSGNVVEKLRIATEAVEKEIENPHLLRSLEAIKRIQPELIPFELLDFNMGERWLPSKYYESYLTKLFDTKTAVRYFPSIDTFKVEAKDANAKITTEFAVTPKQGRTMPGTALAEHALENTAPFFTYEVKIGESTLRLPDNDAIQLAHHRIESIRSGFLDYLRELPQEERSKIERLYNSTFNCYVLRQYDGSHLKFPGLRKDSLGIPDLYSSQKDAAWRLIQNRGGIIDHEVGLGKTLTMIISAHEMKRLGIVKKPVILALKANVSQISQTYRLAYPGDRLLAPNEDDFSPANRQQLFHEIKNNNWDCIVLTHDQFGKIPMSPEIRQRIFQDELDNLEKDLDSISAVGGDISKRMRKGLEIRKNNLNGKLKELDFEIENKKDADINFEVLGIDHLFVDESHQFKNLTFTTRHDRVAGLGNMEGSQKALNMLFAIRTLQERFKSDLCATFLSGTPISNSLTEMYLLFKYLRPREMERQMISNFDAWAAVFARKTRDFEFSITNEIIAKDRFRHFIKVPELAMFYNEIADYKTAAHINLDKPVLEDVLVAIDPTEDQDAFLAKLIQFARTGDGSLIGRPPLSEQEDKGRMLIATNAAKKMALDMRLIDTTYPDHVRTKISVCCAKVAELYHESSLYRGTQLIFCDMGTPGGVGYNIYAELKRKLSDEYEIPAREISFIHDWPQHKKQELFDKFNRGLIRILVGSTPKLGTGTNVQERVVAEHDLDIPYKPSELEQRGGRGARKGNTVAMEYREGKVMRFIYAVKRSLDNYRFNLLKNKQLFISQMKNNSLQVRTIDEGAIDEKTGMNFSEYVAILSGDTSLLEKTKVEKQITLLEGLKSAYMKEQARARWQLESLRSQRESNAGIVSHLQIDHDHYYKLMYKDKDDIKVNPITLTGCQSAEPEVIGSHLVNLYRTFTGSRTMCIGNLYGFDLFIEGKIHSVNIEGKLFSNQENKLFAQRADSDIKYSYNQGKPNHENVKLAARYFLNAIDNVGNLLHNHQKSISELDANIPVLESILANSFPRDKELSGLKEELNSLERTISINIQKTKMEQQGLLDGATDGAQSSSTGETSKIVSTDTHISEPANQSNAESLSLKNGILQSNRNVLQDRDRGIHL